MKRGLQSRSSSCQAGALAALFLLAVPVGVEPAEITLVPQFAEGERVRYRMQLTVVTDSSLNPLGRALQTDQALRLSITMTWQMEVLEVAPAGGVKLRAVIENLSMETSGRQVPAPVEDFTGRAVTYRLSAQGGVSEIEAPDEWLEEGRPPAWLQTWLEQGSGSPADVPGRAVSLGEVWRQERDFDVPGLPTQRLVSESEYLRDEEVNGRPCASILTRFELAGDDTYVPEELAGSTEIARQVEGGGSRLSCYDHRTGRLLQSSQQSRENIRIVILNQPRGRGDEPAAVLESTTTTESQLNLIE
jgi:hypothetical protein